MNPDDLKPLTQRPVACPTLPDLAEVRADDIRHEIGESLLLEALSELGPDDPRFDSAIWLAAHRARTCPKEDETEALAALGRDVLALMELHVEKIARRRRGE